MQQAIASSTNVPIGSSTSAARYSDEQLLSIAREYADEHYNVLGGSARWDRWAKDKGYPQHACYQKRLGNMYEVARLIGATGIGREANLKARAEAQKFLQWARQVRAAEALDDEGDEYPMMDIQPEREQPDATSPSAGDSAVTSVILAGTDFSFSATGLTVTGQPSFDEWLRLGDQLRYINGAVQWWIGDWLNFGERAYGEKYSQALDATDYSYQNLATMKWVATEFPMTRRRNGLSWTHHREVAGCEPVVQDVLLDQTEDGEWTAKQLRTAIHERTAEPPLMPENPMEPPEVAASEFRRGFRAGVVAAIEGCRALLDEQGQDWRATYTHLWLWADGSLLAWAEGQMDGQGPPLITAGSIVKPMGTSVVEGTVR